MYVSYETFKELSGSTINEQEYVRLSSIADLIIDEWTLDRVGRAVKDGEELPESVRTVYSAIVDNLPALLENSKAQEGGVVSSFSNGIDSYSFDVDSKVMDELNRSIGWMLDLLPIEWSSRCIAFKGGNKYAC